MLIPRQGKDVMIKLEIVHKEMNDNLIQRAACIAFNKWRVSHFEPITREELRRLTVSSFKKRMLTEHQILAIEALFMIKLDSYIKEVKTIVDGNKQCEVCSSYYRSDVLDECSSCGCSICSECAIHDSYCDWIDCPKCVSNLR